MERGLILKFRHRSWSWFKKSFDFVAKPQKHMALCALLVCGGFFLVASDGPHEKKIYSKKEIKDTQYAGTTGAAQKPLSMDDADTNGDGEVSKNEALVFIKLRSLIQ